MLRLAPFMMLMLGAAAQAALIKKAVVYKDGAQEFEGYLVYDAKIKKKMPAVLMIPDWMGLGENAKAYADKIAGLGFVVFAADVYGKGVRPKDSNEAAAQATRLKKDRPQLRQHLQSALATLLAVPAVDHERIAAIGYCFGGTSALELARAGADLKAVVTFHGGLDSPTPADGKNIKAKVLALHGADDPFVPAGDLAAFENEMRAAHVDWQLVKYGNAVHSFTNKSAGNDNSKGAAYNALADARSWEAMKRHLAECFK